MGDVGGAVTDTTRKVRTSSAGITAVDRRDVLLTACAQLLDEMRPMIAMTSAPDGVAATAMLGRLNRLVDEIRGLA